jgi:bifunctional DNase/RNase
MIETTVESIRVSLVTQNRVVILREIGGDRHLPIWIGGYEAEAIAMELQGIAPTRPLPYDLMKTMLGELGASVEQIVIADLNEQVFFARILLDQKGRTIEIDARPSDAIALAVRTGIKIMVDDSIMEQAGVAMDVDDGDDSDATPEFGTTGDETSGIASTGEREGASKGKEEGLSVFRDFINSLDLDDFGKKRSG